MKILKRNNWFFHAVSNKQRFLCVTINMQVLVIYTQSARITTIKTLFIFSYSVNCEGHIPWSAHKYTDTGNLLRNYLNFHLNKICWEGKKRKLSCNRNKERGAALGKVYIKFMKNGNCSKWSFWHNVMLFINIKNYIIFVLSLYTLNLKKAKR